MTGVRIKASSQSGLGGHHALRRSPRCSGFTLIEVLVVVAIIALLISILLPSLAAARSTARSAVCCSHLHVLGQGMVFYANDNQGIILRHYGYPGTANTANARNPMLLVPERFSPYLGGRKLPLIPRDIDPGYIAGAPKAPRDQMLAKIFIKMDVLQCPAFPQWQREPTDVSTHVVQEQAYDYSVNAYIMDDMYMCPLGRLTDNADWSKLDRVSFPSKLFYLIDGNKRLLPDQFTDHELWGPVSRPAEPHKEVRNLWWGSDPTMIDDNRHALRANGVFHDGHVESPLIKSVRLSSFTRSPCYDTNDPNNQPPAAP